MSNASFKKKKKFKNKASSTKYFLLILVGFVALILVSELIYAVNNPPKLGVHDYLNMASASADKANVEATLKYLGKASELRLAIEVIENNPDVEIEPKIFIPPTPKNKALQDAFSDYLKSIDYDGLKNTYASRWAKIYYTLGMLAYEQNEPELVAPFWLIAANLGPEWSYYHVELANFFLNQGELNKARGQIEYCLKFYFPQNHCNEFLEENILKNQVESIGSWERQINDI